MNGTQIADRVDVMDVGQHDYSHLVAGEGDFAESVCGYVPPNGWRGVGDGGLPHCPNCEALDRAARFPIDFQR